jgi:hypothetical protein
VGDAGSEEKFLHRWSRRKRADRQDETLSDPLHDHLPVSTANDQADQQAAPAVAADAQPALTDDDMPPIDSLTGDSDFSVFMSPGVSERLRTQALRKLFHLPAFNVTDGLNDYDEDYTRFAGLGNVVTQEMQRMLKRELEANEAAQDPIELQPAVATDMPTEIDAKDREAGALDDEADPDPDNP